MGQRFVFTRLLRRSVTIALVLFLACVMARATVVTPTTFDRSDIEVATDTVRVKRIITNNPVLPGGGWFEAIVDTTKEQISAVGFVDHVHSTYTVIDGVLTYQTPYRTYATVSRLLGFIVQLNPAEIIVVGTGPYSADSATIRVQRDGNTVTYFLNGQPVYTSQVPDGSLSLRGSVTGFAGATSLLLERGDLVRPSLNISPEILTLLHKRTP